MTNYSDIIDIVQWQRCYDDSWVGLITPESMSHPAKFSRGLIQRIYLYCLEQGYFTPGMVILDPFGGIGLGAIATHYGLNWLGNELEPRFCKMAWSWDCPGIKQEDYDGYKRQCESPQDWYKLGLGCCSECVYKAIEGELPQPSLFEQEGYFSKPHRYRGNLELFKKFAKDGTVARLTQGDSRKLGEMWTGKGLVSSPSFVDQLHQTKSSILTPHQSASEGRNEKSPSVLARDYGQSQGQLANMPEGLVSSPPYADQINKGREGPNANPNERWETTTKKGVGYGSESGNLGNMPEGLVSSPPLAGNTGGKGKASRDGIDPALFDRHSGGMVGGMHGTEGNLEGMPPGGLVSSPPFVNTEPVQDKNFKINDGRKARPQGQEGYGDSEGQLGAMGEGLVSSPPFENVEGAQDDNFNYKPRYSGDKLSSLGKHYGDAKGNVGNDSGPTFWSAARDILLQCHSLLPVDSIAVFVTKNYIKSGKEVDFTGNWITLCEQCGFELVEQKRVMLVKNLGTQMSYSGEDKEITIERKSFFRRLHEKKRPDLKIDWETVIIMRRA